MLSRLLPYASTQVGQNGGSFSSGGETLARGGKAFSSGVEAGREEWRGLFFEEV